MVKGKCQLLLIHFCFHLVVLIHDRCNNPEIWLLLLSDCILFFVVKDGIYQLRCPGKTIKSLPKPPYLSLRETHVRQVASQPCSILLINTVRYNTLVLRGT